MLMKILKKKKSRISTELAGLSNQNTAAMQKKVNEDTFPQTSYVAAADSSNDLESTR